MHQPPTEKLRGTVEADETFVGGKPRNRYPRGENNPNTREKWARKVCVQGMLERGGRVRIQRIANAGGSELRRAILDAVEPETLIITDDWSGYRLLDRTWKGGHRVVNHSRREYALPDGTTTNGIESVFSRIKRGLMGVHHNVSRHHLHRYLAHWEFLHNTRFMDTGERTDEAIRASQGKRLVYRDSRGTGAA